MLDITSSFDDGMHSLLRHAAAEGPVAVDATSGATVVLRHADVEALALDHRLAGVGLSFFDLMGIGDGPLRRWYGSLMFTNEGPTHKRLRSLVSRAFTPRAAEAMRSHARSLAEVAFEPIAAAGGGDLIARVADLPMRVMCRLLGVPDADVAVFWEWADALSPTFTFMDPEQVENATRAITSLLEYVDDLAATRKSEPADDLITALLAAEDDGERLSHGDLCDMVANLIVGGHDTTASQLGCTLLTLLREPGETSRLRASPDLLPSAVSETIRFEPSITGVPRTVTEPVSVAGTELDAGSLVLLSTAAANREPGVWHEPDRFDVARFADSAAVPRLLSFGAGTHYCLGAALARMTVEETVREHLALGAVEPAGDLGAVAWRSVLGRAPVALPVVVG